MKTFVKFNIQAKLFLSMLAIVLITGIASVIIGLTIINKNIIGQAYETVQLNLNSFKRLYNEKIDSHSRALNYLLSLAHFKEAVIAQNRSTIYDYMKNISKDLDFDILNVTDARGRVIVRLNKYNFYGDDKTGDPIIKYVIENKKPYSGTEIMDHEELTSENETLANKAVITIIPTSRARKREQMVETQGMILKTALPIIQNGRLVGIIYGAILLNNNNNIVDQMKNLIFQDQKIDNKELGTTTIFLNDLRVSTTVRMKDSSRAIGTLVSEEVYKKVFEHGVPWIEKAFVVDKWYISAYSPVYNIENHVIGMLYVGLLQEKYDRIIRDTAIYYFLMIFISTTVAFLLSFYIIFTITRPVKNLTQAAEQIIKGNYVKTDIISRDELGYLCFVFNKMIDAILEKDKILKESAEKQILQSEKLASLGRLASGIAHEINNPLTGVLTYSSLLLEDLEGTKYVGDLHVIINETMRCRNIVKGILDFARESKSQKTMSNINRIITDSLMILEKHVEFHNISITKRLSIQIPDMLLDVNQMKSVINNLAVNAADAMPSGGELVISTDFDYDENQIVISFKDTGIGISKENLTRVFDPFFTTKDTGRGTGLGLAVTYGIIKRHRGTINITSMVGVGTEITIRLPIIPESEEDEKISNVLIE